MMRVLDLFSGIGGFSLGLERAGMETVAFCEIEEYPRQVLRKHWPDVPIFEDVRKLKGEDVGPVDLICGGYPCQPFSLAGERRGQDDDRHLWPEVFRLLQETRARWFIGENVSGHISMGLDEVLFDLESENYATQSFVIPACAVNAQHRRDRVWIVANARRELRGSRVEQMHRREGGGRQKNERQRGIHRELAAVGYSAATGSQARIPPEPQVDRMAHGIPRRMDRLKCLGNAVVPQIPEVIGRAIMAAEGF